MHRQGMNKSKIISLALLFSLGLFLNAQSNDYYNLKDVKTYRFDHLELSSPKDGSAFIHQANAYNFIEGLRISFPGSIKEITSAGRIGAYIKELDLSMYTGELDSTSFDSCQGVE